jgi:hypothetical protein
MRGRFGKITGLVTGLIVVLSASHEAMADATGIITLSGTIEPLTSLKIKEITRQDASQQNISTTSFKILLTSPWLINPYTIVHYDSTQSTRTHRQGAKWISQVSRDRDSSWPLTLSIIAP